MTGFGARGFGARDFFDPESREDFFGGVGGFMTPR
jgi:hypothetical protein